MSGSDLKARIVGSLGGGGTEGRGGRKVRQGEIMKAVAAAGELLRKWEAQQAFLKTKETEFRTCGK